MDLLQNPFHILNASPGDNRRRIMELADERSLLLNSNECMEARSELTNPRKRLSAEVAWLPGMLSAEVGWLPGMEPKRTDEVLSLLKSSPADLLSVDNLSSIARANLLASGLARLPDHNAKDVTEWILEIAWAFEDLDADELCEIINEERTVSGFPEVSDISAVEAEIQERRRHYRQVIKSALDHLSPKELVKAVTVAVASSTEDGEEHGPVIIADLVDSYEVEAQGFLDKEKANIEALVEKLRAAVDAERSDSILAPAVNQLIQVVKNWDSVAQPIQVSAKSRGLDHDASHRVASLIRGLAIDMFNEHGKLHFSQQLTTMMQEVFKEVGKVADRTAEDADALGEIAATRSMLNAGIPQEKIDAYLENVRSGRTTLTPQQAIDFWENKSRQQTESTTKPTDTSTKREELSKQGLPNPQSQPGQLSPQPSTTQKTVFALLKLTEWPTLPAPWSSVDSGETWVWGDFFLTFQKKPKTILDITSEMDGEKAEYGGMTYHYAMSVFYRIDRNPHGPSHRPIMIIALEQADMNMLTKMFGSEAGELLQAKVGSKMGPLMIGLFTGETRLNLGVYEGGTSSQAVKQRFFEILGRRLGVSGQPKMIGDLAQAHGHEETGLPAKNKKSGCALVILLCIAIGGLGAWGLTFI